MIKKNLTNPKLDQQVIYWISGSWEVHNNDYTKYWLVHVITNNLLYTV